MTRRRKITIFGSIGAVVVALILAQTAFRRDRGTAVRIDEVSRRDLVATVTASGKISPKTAVDIASDITGRIVQIPVEEGQLVRRGDLLLRIDPTQFEASTARAEAMLSSAKASALQARANRDQAKRSLDRLANMRDSDPNLVSVEEFEQAQTNYEVAQAVWESQEHQVAQADANLREASDQLSKTVLRAPMDGKITRLDVEEGAVAIASTFSLATGLLMTISDLSVIQVNVRVDETDVVRLQASDSAEVTIDAFPDTTFVGRVTQISQSAIQTADQSASSGSERAVDYDVEITLDNPPPDIRPDLSATAKVVTDTRDSALSIPIIALTVREHQPISTEDSPRDTTEVETEGVFVVDDGIAQFRPVRVGIAGEEHFEVTEGLTEGDSIVAGPYQTIRDLDDSTAVRSMEEEEENEGRPGRST
jgi:HlyD family secretion protein